jgi:threonine dehydrogenase-like Zn-dependent dehydrogenase
LPIRTLANGAILVRALALVVYGTDREIVSGIYGEAPPGVERPVLDHESFGAVLEAPRAAASHQAILSSATPCPALDHGPPGMRGEGE